jgi:hypothetical protein
MTQGNTPTEAEVYANLDLAKVEKWANGKKIQFNDSKSKAMLITRKRNIENIHIYLNNKSLEVLKEIKYLGIYFDRRLNSFSFPHDCTSHP